MRVCAIEDKTNIFVVASYSSVSKSPVRFKAQLVTVSDCDLNESTYSGEDFYQGFYSIYQMYINLCISCDPSFYNVKEKRYERSSFCCIFFCILLKDLWSYLGE